MSNTVILTGEEVDKLKQHQDTVTSITAALGQTELQIHALKSYADTLKAQYDAVVREQEALSETLSAKYGDGAVNLETGEFTPAS